MNWIGSAEFLHDPVLGSFRFCLDRRWKEGDRALICMCNASTANGERNDPTIGRCMELVPPNIGNFTVVNWEPYVASKPESLHFWREWASRNHLKAYEEICARNEAVIRRLSRISNMRFIAWGALVPQTPLRTKILNAMSFDGAYDLYAFGLTKDGLPKHPMARGTHRIANGTPPMIWRAADAVEAA